MQGETRRPGHASAIQWAGFACLVVGALLRVFDFDAHPLWIDEYGTAWVVDAPDLGGVWQRAVAIQGQSPLYYLVVRGFVASMGDSSLVLRLPSLLAGIALLAAGYWAAQRIFGDARVALAALVALSLDERLIFYTQNARPYALALLCAVLSFGLYARMLGDPRSRTQAAWIVASVATYYFHYLFGIALFGQFLHWTLQLRKRPVERRAEAGAFALLAALMVPGSLQLAALHARRHVLDWVPVSQESWAAAGELALSLVDSRLLVVVAVGLLAAVLVERPRSLRISRSGLALCALWLGIPLLGVTLASSALGVNLLHARYVAVAIPAMPLLYGAMLSLPASPRLSGGLLALFVAASLPLGVLPMLEGRGIFDDWYRAQQWEQAAQAVVENARAGELVLYGTRFVESDAVSLGEAPAHVADFVSWPLRAHLSASPPFQLHALPFRYTPETLQSLLIEIRAAQERIWIVGLPDAIAPLLPVAERRLGLVVRGHQQYGNVHLLGLEPGAP